MFKVKVKSSNAFGVFKSEFAHQIGDLLTSMAIVHDGPISVEIEYQKDKGKQEAEKDVAE